MMTRAWNSTVTDFAGLRDWFTFIAVHAKPLPEQQHLFRRSRGVRDGNRQKQPEELGAIKPSTILTRKKKIQNHQPGVPVFR